MSIAQLHASMYSSEFGRWLAYFQEYPERLSYIAAELEAKKADYRMAISASGIRNDLRAMLSGSKNPKLVKLEDMIPQWDRNKAPSKPDSFEELKTKREALRAIFGAKNAGNKR